MNSTERTLPQEVRRILDDHLDTIERILARSATPREERRAICDEVETQACEVLWQRTSGQPSVQELTAVLAEMDAPESYGPSHEGEPSRDVAANWITAVLGQPLAILASLSPFLAVLVIVLPTPFRPNGELQTLILIGAMTLISTLLSIIAIGNIRRQPSPTRGLVCATFGILGVPLLVLNFSAAMLIEDFDILGSRLAVAKRDAERLLRDELRALQEAANNQPATEDLIRQTKKVESQLRNLAMSRKDSWLAQNDFTLNCLTIMVVCGIALLVSVGLFVWLHRRVRKWCERGNARTG